MEAISELGFPEPLSDLPGTARAGSSLCTSKNPLVEMSAFFDEAPAVDPATGLPTGQEHFWRYSEPGNAWQPLPDVKSVAELFLNGACMAYDERRKKLYRFVSSNVADFAILLRLDLTAAALTWEVMDTASLGLAVAWTTDARMVYSDVDDALYLMGNGSRSLWHYNGCAAVPGGPTDNWTACTGIGGARTNIPAAGATLDIMSGWMGDNLLLSLDAGGADVLAVYDPATDAWVDLAFTGQFPVTLVESGTHALLPGFVILRAEGHRLYAFSGGQRPGAAPFITPIGDTFPSAPTSPHIGNGLCLYSDLEGRVYVATRNHTDVIFQRRQIRLIDLTVRE